MSPPTLTRRGWWWLGYGLVKLPEAKADLHMRIDRDVLDFFRKTGRGYQTRINAVLRFYVERARRG